MDMKTIVACLLLSLLPGPLAFGQDDDARQDISSLVKNLKEGSWQERLDAVRGLGDRGGEAAVSALRGALKDESHYVRAAVPMQLLRAAGEDNAKAIVRDLIDALSDKHSTVRYEAAATLGLIEKGAAEAKTALSAALKDDDKNVRLRAATALLRIDANNRVSIPTLIELVKDGDPRIRLYASAALADIGPKAEPAVPVLIDVLKDTDRTVRWGAAAALRCIGPAAKQALPALMEAMGAEDKSLRFLAALAVAKIDSTNEAAVKTLIESLNDRDLQGQIESYAMLGKNVLPSLIVGRYDRKVELAVQFHSVVTKAHIEGIKSRRRSAAHALGELGQTAKAAVPSLIAASKDPDPEIRAAAAEALKKIQGNNGSQ